MKILVYTCMYNRPQISDLFLTNMEKVKHYISLWCDMEIFACVTGDDSVEVCKKHGIPYYVHENEPLGLKWNAGMERALQYCDFDYVMIMGDDDLMNPHLMDIYQPAMEDNIPYFGVGSIYFYSVKKNQAIEFNYKQPDKLIGCCRMISREALEKTGMVVEVQARRDIRSFNMVKRNIYSLPVHIAKYLSLLRAVDIRSKPYFNLWDQYANKGLDNASELALISSGYYPVKIKTPYIMVTDVKSGQNIWKYENLLYAGIEVPVDKALGHISKIEREKIESLQTQLI
jgi:hypothetical protein